MICSIFAYNRKFSVWQFAFAGTVYSAFLFVPLIYLLRQMIDNDYESGIVSFNYKSLYDFWPLYILSYAVPMGFYIFLVSRIGNNGSYSFFDIAFNPYVIWFAGSIIISVLVWKLSRRIFCSGYIYSHHSQSRELPPLRYLMPFVCLSASNLPHYSLLLYVFWLQFVI